MPLAMIVGRGEQTIADGVGLSSLGERYVILSDARDLDPEEAKAVASSTVTHLTHLEMLLDAPLPSGPLHVHFDTDVIDPVLAPAMSYPAPGGPSPDTVKRVFHRLADTERICAVSVSAWNPKLDTDGWTHRLSMDLLGVLAAGDETLGLEEVPNCTN
jgi:arginase